MGPREPRTGPQGPGGVRARAPADPEAARRLGVLGPERRRHRGVPLHRGPPRPGPLGGRRGLRHPPPGRRRAAPGRDRLPHRAEGRPRSQRRGPAGVPGGDLLHPGGLGLQVHEAAGPGRRPGEVLLPGHRDRHDRGPPLLRRQQRPARVRRARVPLVRPGDGEPRPPGVGGGPQGRLDVHRGRRPGPRRVHARRAGRGRHRGVRGQALRPGPGPGGLPLPAGAPLAVVEQDHGHLRGRDREPPSGAARRGRGRVPGPAVDPYVLQHHDAGEALREDRHLGPQHGLHARPVGGLHGGHPGDQRLAAPADRGRRGPAVGGLLDHPRARGHRLPPPPVRARHRPLLAVPQDAGRPVARVPGQPPPGGRAPGDDGLAAASTPRAGPSSAR